MFGQATAQVLPRTNLTLGARYTDEKQHYELTYPVALRVYQKFSKATFRVAVDYHIGHDAMVYASYNTGFKSGGFNLLLPGNNFRPEYLDASEVGLKSELFDRRVRLNLSGFYYKDRNVQVLSAFQGGTLTSNAAEATIKGVEAEVRVAPTDSARLSGGVSIQRGHYDNYPDGVRITPTGASSGAVSFGGNETLVTPHVTGSVTAENRWVMSRGELTATATLIYNSGFFWQAENRLRQPSYALLNGALTWSAPQNRYAVRLWVKNLTDATYYVARLSVAGVGDVQEQAAPRTFGVTVSAHF